MTDQTNSVWSTTPLGSLLDVQGGFAFKSKQFTEKGGVPLIRIRDLKAGKGAVVNYKGEYDSQYLVRNGDLLVGMDGEFRCYEWQGGKALLNQRVCRLENFNEMLLPKFLLYGINKYLKEIEDVTPFTTVKHLSAKTIKSIAFPLPPLEDQRRIVAVLDEAFAGLARARANAEANLADARELLSAYREERLAASSRAGWTERKLEDLITIKHGFAFKSKYFTESGEYAVLTPGNFYEEGGFRQRGGKQRFYSGDFPDEFLLKPGDLLVAMTEQAPGLLGSCIIVPDEGLFLHNQRLGLIEPREKTNWNPEYFAEAFNLRSLRDGLSASCSGATVRHTSPKRILSEVIPYCDDQSELQRAADELAEVNKKVRGLIAGKKEQLKNLDDLRQSLLQRAFSGGL